MSSTQFTPDQMNISGKVQSFTNAASAGGTFYYVNNGGVKEFWGQTAGCSVAAGGNAAFGINLPSGFFNSIQFAVSNAIPSGDARQYSNIASASTTGVTIYLTNLNGGGTYTPSAFVYVRGT